MNFAFNFAAILAGLLFAGSALALNPGERVDNFRLLDQTGASHELYCLSDARAVVLMTYGNDLPILIDETQLIGEALGVNRTADVFVVDPKNWSLVYRGPLDDRAKAAQAVGKERAVAPLLSRTGNRQLPTGAD